MTTTPFAEPTRGSYAVALLLCRYGVEVWKTTHESAAYEVSNLGRVRRATTKRVLKGSVQQGYRRYQFAGVGGCQSHRVVARAFIPNPEEKPTVDHHKSSEKTNNKLTNLRWATLKEQQTNTKRRATIKKNQRPVRMLHAETRELIQRFESAPAAARYLNKEYRGGSIAAALRGRSRTAYGFAWEYDPAETIEGEEWRKIPRDLLDLLKPHEVSSHGRLRNTTTGRVGIGHTLPNGIVVFGLTFTDGRTKAIPVARVVASVFLGENPESKPCAAHIDGDKANNHVSNLTWATHAEMTRAACDRGTSNSWTKEEDAAILNMYETRGRPKRLSWTNLPEILQGRTKGALISRLCTLLGSRPQLDREPKPNQWTEEEDAALRDFTETADRDNRGIKWKDTTLPEILQNRTIEALKCRLKRRLDRPGLESDKKKVT